MSSGMDGISLLRQLKLDNDLKSEMLLIHSSLLPSVKLRRFQKKNECQISLFTSAEMSERVQTMEV